MLIAISMKSLTSTNIKQRGASPEGDKMKTKLQMIREINTRRLWDDKIPKATAETKALAAKRIAYSVKEQEKQDTKNGWEL